MTSHQRSVQRPISGVIDTLTALRQDCLRLISPSSIYVICGDRGPSRPMPTSDCPFVRRQTTVSYSRCHVIKHNGCLVGLFVVMVIHYRKYKHSRRSYFCIIYFTRARAHGSWNTRRDLARNKGYEQFQYSTIHPRARGRCSCSTSSSILLAHPRQTILFYNTII